VGDVLLYDARLLHYGLANCSNTTKRPLLYVSFTRTWFQDQQNWGTASLFP
jgi:ectoine hydroxylase-related dioxygenase (phytanoyl-CoA dioxygenase family)